jgi:membrane-associated phospholipid phosphatase
MRRLLPVLLIISLLAGPAAHAQRADTSAFKATQLIAPGVLIASGVGIHCWGHQAIDVPVNNWFQNNWRAGGPERSFDNYLQYAPLVAYTGLGLLGVKSKHAFTDRMIQGAISFATLGIISWSCKELIDSPRPNGVDNRSFPSGHTDFVFIGAELVRMEYGWGWGAAAYAVATTVAIMRNYNNWHWLSDCLFGAGLGILTAHVGEWLLEPVKDLFHIPTIAWDGLRKTGVQAAFAPTVDPFSGAVCASLAFVF